MDDDRDCGLISLAADPGFARMREWTRSQMAQALGDLAATGDIPIADPPLALRIFNALLRGLMVEQGQDPDNGSLADEDLAWIEKLAPAEQSVWIGGGRSALGRSRCGKPRPSA